MKKIQINRKKYNLDYVFNDIKNTNLIECIEAMGIYIPNFCYNQELSISGNCRMCVIEAKTSIKPIISCVVNAKSYLNNEIYTRSPLTFKSRESIIEFLLLNHPIDCAICDQAGECDLQDYALMFGTSFKRFYTYKRTVEDKHVGFIIKTTMTRCIHCTRCVRFGTEVAGLKEFGIFGRGSSSEVGLYLSSDKLTSELSGNFIDVCPVGSLSNRIYKFVRAISSRVYRRGRKITYLLIKALIFPVRIYLDSQYLKGIEEQERLQRLAARKRRSKIRYRFWDFNVSTFWDFNLTILRTIVLTCASFYYWHDPQALFLFIIPTLTTCFFERNIRNPTVRKIVLIIFWFNVFVIICLVCAYFATFPRITTAGTIAYLIHYIQFGIPMPGTPDIYTLISMLTAGYPKFIELSLGVAISQALVALIWCRRIVECLIRTVDRFYRNYRYETKNPKAKEDKNDIKGALTNRPSSFTIRPWEHLYKMSLDSTNSFAQYIKIAIAYNKVQRVLPSFINEYEEETPWINDKTRFAFEGVYSTSNKIINKKKNLFIQDIVLLIYFYDHLSSQDKIIVPNIFFTFGNTISIELLSLLDITLKKYSFLKMRTFETLPIINNDIETNYQLNESVKSLQFLNKSDLCMLVGANTRYEGSYLNLKLRKRYLKDDFPIISFSSYLDNTLPIHFLGSLSKTLNMFCAGNNIVNQDFILSNNPIIIINSEFFQRKDCNNLFNLIETLKSYTFFTYKDWNGLNILNNSLNNVGICTINKFSCINITDLHRFKTFFFINIPPYSLYINKFINMKILNYFHQEYNKHDHLRINFDYIHYIEEYKQLLRKYFNTPLVENLYVLPHINEYLQFPEKYEINKKKQTEKLIEEYKQLFLQKNKKLIQKYFFQGYLPINEESNPWNYDVKTLTHDYPSYMIADKKLMKHIRARNLAMREMLEQEHADEVDLDLLDIKDYLEEYNELRQEYIIAPLMEDVLDVYGHIAYEPALPWIELEIIEPWVRFKTAGKWINPRTIDWWVYDKGTIDPRIVETVDPLPVLRKLYRQQILLNHVQRVSATYLDQLNQEYNELAYKYNVHDPSTIDYDYTHYTHYIEEHKQLSQKYINPSLVVENLYISLQFPEKYEIYKNKEKLTKKFIEIEELLVDEYHQLFVEKNKQLIEKYFFVPYNHKNEEEWPGDAPCGYDLQWLTHEYPILAADKGYIEPIRSRNSKMRKMLEQEHADEIDRDLLNIKNYLEGYNELRQEYIITPLIEDVRDEFGRIFYEPALPWIELEIINPWVKFDGVGQWIDLNTLDDWVFKRAILDQQTADNIIAEPVLRKWYRERILFNHVNRVIETYIRQFNQESLELASKYKEKLKCKPINNYTKLNSLFSYGPINQFDFENTFKKTFKIKLYKHFTSKNIFETSGTFQNAEGFIKKSLNIISSKRTIQEDWQYLRLISKNINNYSFTKYQKNIFIKYNLKDIFKFKNYIALNFYAIKNLNDLAFFYLSENSTFFLIIDKFFLTIQKNFNTKFKFWLEDFYLGGYDIYSTYSKTMILCSNLLREKTAIFIHF